MPEVNSEISVRKKTFRDWLRNSTINNDDSDRVKKLVPGITAGFAFCLFVSKEFIAVQIEHVNLTSEFYNLILNFLNIIILVYIIFFRGFGSNDYVKRTYVSAKYANIDVEYCKALEDQFKSWVYRFFGFTLALYLIFCIKDFYVKKNIESSIENRTIINSNLRSIRKNVSEIQQKYICRDTTGVIHILSEKCASLTSIINGLISSRKYEYSNTVDSYLTFVVNVPNGIDNRSISYTKVKYNLNNSVNTLSYATNNALNSIEEHVYIIDSLLQNDSDVSSNLNRTLLSTRQIRKAIINNNDSRLYTILKGFELVISNFGALCLIAAFLVLYSKTLKQIVDLKSKKVEYASTINPFNIIQFYRRDIGKSSTDESSDFQDDSEKGQFTTQKISVASGLIIFSLSAIILAYSALCNGNGTDWVWMIFECASGFVNAIAMCLLIARFESSHFESSILILVSLYTYAIVQAFYGLFSINIMGDVYLVQDVVKTLALIFKCIMYLYILWIYRSDRLLFFFYHKTTISNKPKLNWTNFLNTLYSNNAKKNINQVN